MNYFTPKWLHGDAAKHPAEKYQEHLTPLLPEWPPDVQALAVRVNLHDGLIRKLAWNMEKATLFLGLRCGDLQVGYFDLDLHYSRVLFSQLDWASLRALNANENSSALYDEVDEDAGRFVHRILFIASRRARSSRRFRASRRTRISHRGMVSCARRKFRYHEIAIRFGELHLAATPQESRFSTNGTILA